MKRDAVATKIHASSESDEQDAAKLIREKLVAEAVSNRGERHGKITLQTGGRPITIEVKQPNEQPKTATSDSLASFMKKEGFSLAQMKRLQSYNRKTYGKKSVEPHAHKTLVQTTHQFDDFLEATDEQFVEKDNKVLKTVTR